MSKVKYATIGIVLIILVIAGFVVFRARQRRSEVAYQTDEALALIKDVNVKTVDGSSSWKKIQMTLQLLNIKDVPDDISGYKRELEYSKIARSDISDMRGELDTIRANHGSIGASLRKLDEVPLPDWINEYVMLKSLMVEKDGERTDVTEKLLDDLGLYYQFSEIFMEGMIAQAQMEENLVGGVEAFEDEDYLGARRLFQEASDSNSIVQLRVDEASKLINFDYFTRIDANRRDAEDVIEKYLSIVDLVDEGAYQEADNLYQEAKVDYDVLLSQKLIPSDLLPEHQAWWSNNIEPKLEQTRQLTDDIDQLEAQLGEFYREHTTE